MLIPHLRAPIRGDIKNAMTTWLDAVHQGFAGNGAKAPDFTSAECVMDLAKLQNLRNKLSEEVFSSRSYREAREIVPALYEYHAMLLECERRGFPSYSGLPLKMEWKSAFGGTTDGYSGLAYERASVLWNLAALEAYSASMQDLSSKKGWMAVSKHFHSAYTYIHHLKETLGASTSSHTQDIDFHPNTIKFWENAILAQGQMAGYEKAHSGKRINHLLLSKLSQGASPIWDAAAESCCKLSIQEASEWSLCAEAWSAFLNARAEYHESCVVKEKGYSGDEIARLEKAITYANSCHDLMSTGEVAERLQRELPAFLQELQSRYHEAQQSNTEPVPQDLREIRGELLSKDPGPLPQEMMELKSPLFTSLMGPGARQAIERFNRDMDQFLFQMTAMVEEKTESARKALASVNLPHSLTAYNQEQSGGGIPMEMWERVETVQREKKIAILKQDHWELRDVAEQARSIFVKTRKQLDEDVEMDNLFREQNPSFEGHDVEEIQESFRQSLANYEKLLSKSQEGDAVLLRRLEVLDQDPKFKLLQFGKSQLDRLLPGSDDGRAAIDTTQLSRLLVELSNLFHDRDSTLEALKEEIRKYDIRAKVSQVNPASPTADQDYQLAVKQAQKSFSGIAYEIQLNIDRQSELMEVIMEENEWFMDARDAGANTAASESCIAMIEDAIDEIEQLSQHMKEGKDFYEVVIPKLENLKHQVGDASVRLTVERCEFEDSHNNNAGRRQQEIDDARMAASLAGGTGAPTTDRPSRDSREHPLTGHPDADYQGRADVSPTASHPGFEAVSHAQPQVRVDDEKLASLVAMDFDPDKVVEALRKYDNNVEQALNELLSS